jgi:hypothetical protein
MKKNSECKTCNSIGYKFPNLLKEWDMKLNNNIDPYSLTAGSAKKIWWRCEKKHEYYVPINYRTSGSGCPSCRLNIVPLFTEDNEFMSEWDYSINIDDPHSLNTKSKKEAWWICKLHGAYKKKISDRAKGLGCIICSNTKRAESVRLARLNKNGSFKDKFPHLVEQWHPSKNEDKKPEDFSVGSHQKIWWRCRNGHEWLQSINSRANIKIKVECRFCKSPIK